MIYNVLDVCRHVINYSDDIDCGISNLKLQKILYFIQAYFLINTPDNRACFHEPIEAWDFGPVVPVAYHEYKAYGATNIPRITEYAVIDETNLWNSEMVEYSDNVISCEDKDMMNEVVKAFEDYSASDLVELTHAQDPWKDAYVPRMNNEITLEAIREFFDE